MEPLAPFEIDALRRDWIVGMVPGAFFSEVEGNVRELSAGPEEVVVLQESEPVVFAAKFFAAVWLGLPVALANPAWAEAERGEFSDLLTGSDLERGSILIPTGGTTGGVKLAIHDWASLAASARGLQSFLGGGPINSCCVLPLFHVSGLMQLIRSFLSGGQVRFDYAEVEGFCLSLVPTQLQRALKDEKSIRKLNTARAIFVGGAGIPERVVGQAREWKLPVFPVYGMTETAAMVAIVSNEDFLMRDDPGAEPLGDARFSIERDERIRITSSSLFKGYLGRAADLSEGFVVNDRGCLDEAGRLHVLGRLDRLINTGGEKVDPAEVEQALLELHGVSEALVVGEPDEEWGQSVVAYLVGDFSGERVTQIKKGLSGRLVGYKVPKQVRIVDELPLDARGKFRRPEQRG